MEPNEPAMVPLIFRRGDRIEVRQVREPGVDTYYIPTTTIAPTRDGRFARIECRRQRLRYADGREVVCYCDTRVSADEAAAALNA